MALPNNGRAIMQGMPDLFASHETYLKVELVVDGFVAQTVEEGA